MASAIFRYSSIIALLFLAVWVLNAFVLEVPWLGLLLAIAFLATCGLWLGRGLSPDADKASQWWLGAWILLSLVAILGAASYYVYAMPPEIFWMMILIAPPVTWWIGRREGPSRLVEFLSHWRERGQGASRWHWGAAALGLIAFLVAIQTFAASATEEALRSPWPVVPPAAFIAVAAGFLCLFALLYRGRGRAISLPLASLGLFAVISVALFVFPVGFGFDPFIHRATESHIALNGSIEPKPFYYIGQYALVLFLHHGFQIPIDLADKVLLPVLAALLLPAAAMLAGRALLKDRRDATLAVAALFLLPIGSFIATTPQGLGNLWNLMLALAAVPLLAGKGRPGLVALGIGAAAALSIHPIAGIPAALFWLFLLARRVAARNRAAGSVLAGIVGIVGLAALPGSFALNAARSGAGSGIDFSALSPSRLLEGMDLGLFLENRFSPVLDFAYLYGLNAAAILVIIAIMGLWLARRRARKLWPLAAMAGVLLANYLVLLAAVDFSFLIEYERANYAERLIPLALFFLFPFILIAIGRAAGRLRQAPASLRGGFVALLAALALSSFYLAYPRDDAYGRNPGFTVGKADVEAVQAVDLDADGRPYVALANQNVSAAAIASLGFHYYGDLFFYPIPTGGALYERFLEMNEQPGRETAEDARRLALGACGDCQIDVVYYLVNAYWWQADRLVETGKQNADAWFSVGDGAIHVFRYDFAQ